MKRFHLITETDARLLEPGSVIALEPGGCITPLARDTLRARRVTVVDAPGDETLEGLAPSSTVRRIVVAADHTGVALRRGLVAHLRGRGLAVVETGAADAATPADYPDVAAAAAREVARGEADAAIVIDGAGIGSAIAANKIRGIRAAMCSDQTLARYARAHNGANVLTLGATLLDLDAARAVVDAWLATPMTEARYIRRLAKIRRLEREQR
jgi:ribose 5-phosphate isomerase B